MMSTVEKPQKDNIKEGWKMHQRLNFSSQQSEYEILLLISTPLKMYLSDILHSLFEKFLVFLSLLEYFPSHCGTAHVGKLFTANTPTH